MADNALKMCGLLLTLALVAGCGKDATNEQATGELPGQAPPAAAVDMAPPAPTRSDVDFTISPAMLPECPGAAPVQAKLAWVVKDTTIQEVRVEVSDNGQDNWKLLSLSGRQGEVETGPWVRPGSRFRLVDAATGGHLGAVQVAVEPCADGVAG